MCQGTNVMWLKQMNTTASDCPYLCVPAKSLSPLVFTYVSAFQVRVARRLTFRSNQRLEGRMIGWFQCTILQIILLFAEVPLRSTFQRSRGIIVKRLSPFYLERLCSPNGSHPSLIAFVHHARCSRYPSFHSYRRSTHSIRSTAFHSLFTPTSFITFVALTT